MRYLRIFLLHCEEVFQERLRSFIWFLFSFVNPLILILFWRGASRSHAQLGLGMPDLTMYYFFLIIAGSLLISHIEEDVGLYDIKQGSLAKYLLRPFSYFWAKFFVEIPYRILQGFYGIVAVGILIFLFGRFTTIDVTLSTFVLSVVIAILAFFLSFTFKMIVGLLAFWIIEVRAIFETVFVASISLNGTLMPIDLYPPVLEKIATALPFSHMVYFPIIAFQGRLGIGELLVEIVVQSAWLLAFVLVYKVLWYFGVRKFAGVGQ